MGRTVSLRAHDVRLDRSTADRRAVLQLLLKRGKSYDELAALLRIEPGTVRDRALDALERLADAGGVPVSIDPQERSSIADFLLGQQSALRARRDAHVARGRRLRAPVARVVSGELREGGIPDEAIAEVPADDAELDEAFDALEAPPRGPESAPRGARRPGSC